MCSPVLPPYMSLRACECWPVINPKSQQIWNSLLFVKKQNNQTKNKSKPKTNSHILSLLPPPSYLLGMNKFLIINYIIYTSK